jgi:hypothetical protein
MIAGLALAIALAGQDLIQADIAGSRHWRVALERPGAIVAFLPVSSEGDTREVVLITTARSGTGFFRTHDRLQRVDAGADGVRHDRSGTAALDPDGRTTTVAACSVTTVDRAEHRHRDHCGNDLSECRPQPSSARGRLERGVAVPATTF